MTKWFKGFEWIYFICCVLFCIYAFVDKEYVLGLIFTVITIVAAINTVRTNRKEKSDIYKLFRKIRGIRKS